MSNNPIQPDERQEKAWHMRYTLGWTLEHIGRRLGIGKPAVIQRAAAIKTDICNTFGVPDAKLERNAANLAGAKTADYAHKVDAGLPRCRRIEETLNARLVPMFDPTGRLFVAYDSPVPEDEIFALEQTRTASMSGAITRNEIRQAVGLDPVPWGEQPLVPNNMVDVDPTTGKPQHFQPDSMPPTAEGRE